MLCDVDLCEPDERVLSLIKDNPGDELTCVKLHTGIYQLNHFNFHHFLDEPHVHHPVMDGPDPSKVEYWYRGSNVGVCDHWHQVLQQYPELQASNRKFVVAVTLVGKDGPWPDWAWEKWEPYIGDECPMAETIGEEPNITKVYCYAIYELKGAT